MKSIYFILSLLLFFVTGFAQNSFEHKVAAAEFENLLKEIQLKLPKNLRGYKTESILSGRVEAVGNLKRNSVLEVDLAAKELLLKVIEAPQKGNVLKKSGTLTVRVYSEAGKVWVEQRFLRDPVADWKIPVNYDSGSLVGSAENFQYFDQSPQAIQKRKVDPSYNLKARLSEAGFSETPSTQYQFAFSANLSSENPSLSIERIATGLSTGEKDESGSDVLKTASLKISVLKDAVKSYED